MAGKVLVCEKQSKGTEKAVVHIHTPSRELSSRSYSREFGDGETSSSMHNGPSLSYRELQCSKENTACCIGRKARDVVERESWKYIGRTRKTKKGLKK